MHQCSRCQGLSSFFSTARGRFLARYERRFPFPPTCSGAFAPSNGHALPVPRCTLPLLRTPLLSHLRLAVAWAALCPSAPALVHPPYSACVHCLPSLHSPQKS